MKEWERGGLSGPAILTLVIGVVFYLSMLSVKQELDIVIKLFPPGLVPNELRFKDRFSITLQTILFMALYFFLGYVVRYIGIASLSMTLIACNDYITRKKIADNFRKYFSDDKYAPLQSDSYYETIKESRKAIEWFLFELPQLPKEVGRVIGCAFAFSLAAYSFFRNTNALMTSLYSVFATDDFHMIQAITKIKLILLAYLERLQGESFNSYAYIILISTLVLNEIITARWRLKRKDRLKRAEV